MKLKTIIAALSLSLCAFAAQAKGRTYQCDAQVEHMPTRTKGAYIMDAGTLVHVKHIWALTLQTAEGPQNSYFGDETNAPTYEGYPSNGVHFVDHVDKYGNGSETTYDILESADHRSVYVYVTPMDDSGNQMKLMCKEEK